MADPGGLRGFQPPGSATDRFTKLHTYLFTMFSVASPFKEVECFVYSKALNVLVTGSPDHVVRVWNPYVTARPVARLRGHAVGVVDVAIQEQLLIIISYSKDAVRLRLVLCLGANPSRGRIPMMF